MTKQFPHRGSVRFFLLSALFAAVLIIPLGATAEETMSTEEWDITADKIIRYEKPQSVVAEGNIELIKRKKVPPQAKAKDETVSDWALLLEEEVAPEELTPADLPEAAEDVYRTEVTIKADWAAYDVTLNSIKARGNVEIITADDHLFAEQATVDLESETGTFTNATILRKEHDLHLEGEVIEKTGYKTYHIENGWVITCKLEDDETAPWSFAASDAVIEQDGYAVLKHARFQIKDIPVFYIPWMIVPAKNKRQTGFIFPEISSSNNSGFGVNIPFFWNISDSTDMTIYTQYMVERGYMPGLEFRYIKSDTDKGVAMVNYLHDELSDPEETEYYRDTGYTHDNKDRYWFRAKADQVFGDEWITRLDLDIVSDRDYLSEFKSGSTGFDGSNEYFLDTFGRSLANKTDDTRANTLKVLKSWGTTSFTGEFLAINDVRADKSGDTPIWQLPSLEYDGAIPLGGFGDLTLDWDSSYVNFWREEGIGGHRFDISPKLSAPIPLSQYLESRAEIGIRDTYYIVETYGDSEWENDDTQNRFLYDFSAEVGSTLMRTFALNSDNYSGLTHQIRPYFEYDYRPEEDQDDLPYFSGIDRIGQKNGITYGFDNFFDLITKKKKKISKNDEQDGSLKEYGEEESSEEYTTGGRTKEYGYIKINQSYSFLDEDSDEPFSDIFGKIKWIPVTSSSIIYKTYFDVYGDGFVSHNLQANYNNSRGDQFGIEYIYKDDGDTEQVNALLTAALLANWSIDFKLEHSLADEETNEANLAFIYQATCWSVEFATEYTPEDTTYMVIFNLANIGSPFGLHY